MENNIQSGTGLDSSLNDNELEEHIKENTANNLFAGCEQRDGLPVISMDKLMSRLKELGFKNALAYEEPIKVGEFVISDALRLLYSQQSGHIHNT